MTPQDEAKQYANARFFESDRANGEAWVISYTAYLDALTSEKLRSSKLLEALKRMYYIFVEIGFREDGELAAPFNEVLSACESAKAQIKAYES